ncbi:MAG: hypothetical protein LUI05_04070 [Oscillospiraceae bacterium]|nr:hypothetical protein [Oscillospiraceae bacterium]
MSYSLYQLAFIFLIYAVLGWICEEVFAFVKHGKIINRGFLAGPVCPIYGFGMLIISACLAPIRNIPLLLFLGSAILTTALEFLTGFILEQFFHTKWWDYSKEHFNVKGYICLKFSILWGLAGVFMMDIVHPPVMKLIDRIPHKIGCIILAVAAVILVIDITTTLISMIDLRRSLKRFDELYARAEEFKAKLESAAEVGSERLEERTSQLKSDLAHQSRQLNEKCMQLSAELHKRHRRFLNAFPDFENGERFSKLKKAFEESREKHKKQ